MGYKGFRKETLISPMTQELWAWIDARMEELNFQNDSQLADKAGISRSVLSKARKGIQPMGYEACRAIAHALKVRDVVVLRLAGYLDPDEQLGLTQIEWLSLINGQSEEKVRQYIAVVRAMQSERAGENEKAKKSRS